MNTITEPTTEQPTDAPAFSINSDSAADWLLKQIAALDAERDLLVSQHQAAVKRVDSDRESLLHVYGEQLQAYAAQKVAADKRGRKSCILAHGTLAFRTVPASIKVSDPAAALHAAKQLDMPDMVFTVETLNMERYRKAAHVAIERQGCLLPGVEFLPAREAFSVRFGGKGKDAPEETTL